MLSGLLDKDFFNVGELFPIEGRDLPLFKIGDQEISRGDFYHKSLTLDHSSLEGKYIGLQLSAPLKLFSHMMALWGQNKVPVLLSPSTLNRNIKLLMKDTPFYEVIDDNFNELISNQPSELSKIALDDPAVVIFTSGSSGPPSAILLSFKNIFYSAKGLNEFLDFKKGDLWKLQLPHHHVAGLMIFIRALFAGGQVVIEDDPNNNLNQFISLVPAQLYELIEKPSQQQYKCILIGGSQVSSQLLKKAIHLGLPIVYSYGLSEMSSTVYCEKLSLNDGQIKRKGTLLPYREISTNKNNNIISVRGKTRFSGKFINGRLTSPFNPDGWYQTNDLAEISSTGLINFLGRRDHIFISGGENINPTEIENALMEMPQIKKAYIVPVTHDKFNQVPFALIESTQLIFPKDLELVLDFLKERLQKFQLPKGMAILKSENLSLKKSRQELTHLASKLWSQ